MRILTESDIAATGEKILLHSNPGCGKTRLATSLPYGPKWGEKAVFVPFDYKERSKRGILPHYRDRVIVVERDTPDPYTFLNDVLDKDWEKEHGARTIVLDTLTNWSHDLMEAALNSGAYKSVVVQMGRGGLKMADQPHWGMVHKMTQNVVRKIKSHPLNIIASFWSDWKEPEGVGDGGNFGGPVTVNMTMSKHICGEFDNVFYLRAEHQGAGKPAAYTVHTAPYGFWCAKLHIAAPQNTMPSVLLEGDPRHFWEQFDKAQEAPLDVFKVGS